MKADEVLSQARDTMTIKRVFSESYEKNGVALITAAGLARLAEERSRGNGERR